MRPLICILILLAFVACSQDDGNGDQPAEPARRTVVVYMSGENNLTYYGYLDNDLTELKAGRQQVNTNDQLVVFVDRLSATEKPFLALVTKDNRLDTLYRYETDFYSTDPTRMADVLAKAVELCPATEDYGLVLWGHANGWLIEKDSTATHPNRAYGYDAGDNTTGNRQGRWMNIPSLRQVLTSLPVKWKFIFFDCCNMLNAEVAYELRDCADYLIGSPAEIPGIGAPYQTVVGDLLCHDDATMYTQLCDHYYAQGTEYQGQRVPLAVVSTAAVPQLAEATRQVLPQVDQYLKTTEAAGAVYYYADPEQEDEKLLYDMQDIVREALKDDAEQYRTWHDAFSEAVVYNRASTYWQVNSSLDYYVKFSDFTEFRDGMRVFKHGNDCCGVMSMYFPMEKFNHTAHSYNEDIKQCGWYWAVGWPSLGW